MTGGITLWKDRGYDVEVAAHVHRRAARALLAPLPAARGRHRRPAEAARRQGAAARRRRARLADRALPRRRRRRHARHRRRRRRRRLEPPAPGHPHDRPHRRPEGRLGRAADQRAQPRRQGRQVQARAWTPRTSWRSSRATTSSSTASTTSRRATCSTTRPCGCSIPVVSAAILGFEGQLSVFKPYDGPCYRCLFRQPPPAELAPSCGANGVLGVLPGTMGLLQATEVVKLIVGAGEPLIGRLLHVRRARRDVHRAQGPPRPRLPDLLARARRRSRTTRWASSPTTRRSAPRLGSLTDRDGHDPDPAGPAPVRRRRARGRPPTATSVGDVLRRARRRPSRDAGPALRRRTATSTATSTSTSTTRTCACSTASRRRSRERDSLVILPAMAGGATG